VSQLFFDPGPPSTGQKVCLATTAYDSPDASYTFSLATSREALRQAGIQTAYLLLHGNCHVDDARNSVVQEFLLSDCTDLVFLDADVSWNAGDLVRLCQHDADIVGGVYPFRREGAQSRENMPVQLIHDATPDENGLLPVGGLPTGFMRIRRHVLETLAANAEKHWKRDDHRAPIPIIFERAMIDGQRWGGDLNFCRKWRATGGKVFADAEMRLGHTAKSIIYDSLGAFLRRQSGETLHHVIRKVREGSEDIGLLTEAWGFLANPFGAQEDVLSLAMLLARKADGPIIETGSGLTTLVMAAANPKQTVWCLEHDETWLRRMAELTAASGLNNIVPVHLPIVDGWYDASRASLPGHFALGLNDGPPRTISSRMGFFSHFGAKADVIISDDADDFGYATALTNWANDNGKRIDFIERAALMRPKAA
jgi:hypothetical protein